MVSKPTVAIVPGACHTPQHWVDLTVHLQKAGFAVSCKQLASVDSADPAACSVSKDITAIQSELLQPLLDNGKDILLVCHSAAGLAGGAAAIGHSKPERTANGQQGGIVGLVFVAAFLAFQGLPSFGKLPDGTWPADFTVNEEKCIWTFAKPANLYAPDVPGPLARKAISALRPMSLNCVTDVSASLVTGWATSLYKGRMAYIVCTEDAQMQPAVQSMSIEKSRGDWTIAHLHAGHSPFLSCPAELTRVIVSLLDKFRA